MSTKDTPPSSPIASRMIQPRFGELVQTCRQLAMNHLAELLGNVFSQVDDTLFECAEKAENNQVQALFFDAMREVRRERPTLERTYHQRIAQGLSDFLEGKLPTGEPFDEMDVDQLTLIGNDEYEETLLITNMVNQVKAHCAQPLFALDQRLALLNNGSKIGEDRNPFGPQAIAQAYRETLAQSAFALRIKTILYVLFDQHVMQHLAPLYEQLNQRLADAGILPNLKFRPQQSPSRPAPPAAARQTAPEAPAAVAPESPSPAAPPKSASELPDMPPADRNALFGGLAVLLAEHRRRGDKATLFGNSHSIVSFGPPAATATTTYSANELLEALNRLQRESARELAQRLRQPQPVEALKADLQRQLEAGSAQPGNTRLTDQEADVIDLVGMVFDFILDDDNLPDSCKTTLSHLHTPYLKVALQDKQLFTQHHHPARKLLNAMAQAGVLYGGEGEERSLLAKMHWVVERVIQDFVGDLGLFDALLGEFNEYVANLRQKVELRERRAMEAARGRDRLLAAREHALEAIAKVTRDRDLPQLVRNFLELSWCDALTFIALRNGEHSDEWKRACEVGERLAWSVTPLDAAGREHLQALRLGLLDELRKGLEVLGGYHEDGIRRLLQDLVACQHAIQAKQPQVAAQLKQELPESPLGAMLGAEGHTLDRTAGNALSERARSLVKELGQVEFGTWFEFHDATPPRRLKLSWFSPTTRNYMFVDHTGQRVAVKPIVQLAREMETGKVRLVPTEHAAPLMDRALNAIYRVLQRFTGRSPAQN
ncbi:DUF1631 domain-containing protein [Pseudomonas sp. ZM23]|uniref:DUF1631 domain-containing protein n=1 Tax=Pseudomonas triclosanedens TaxID=2961893 RepID=A0ABY7A243_9PSED|nr:DUF1631 domain-containing protein [Pseudomonas triclosanedens]MCP8463859.1 DUF1631 domain-containing protein [Pseudomonas triclosanedens]MCP8468943.1 DUF1631 domain-containing protein [Pseudomonas triclosanedens]MCP8475665.1 DUF1631 domain-containing protein [Pseudomonas triclosanedens]WAI50621.1 DUF1631 domain-containing protein [Pseudomonas triclosanedens]